MRCTAGTGIISGNDNHSHLSGDLDLAPVSHLFFLFFGRIKDLYFEIFPDCLICTKLYFLQIFHRDLSVKIHRTVFISQMKTNIFITIAFMHDSGDDMLTCMLLHLHKPQFPVKLSCHLFSDRQFLVRSVEDLSLLLLHIQYLCIPQISGICILTAPFREESGLIQYDFIIVFLFLTGEDRRLK